MDVKEIVISINLKPDYYIAGEYHGVKSVVPKESIATVNDYLEKGYIVKSNITVGDSIVFVLSKS